MITEVEIKSAVVIDLKGAAAEAAKDTVQEVNETVVAIKVVAVVGIEDVTAIKIPWGIGIRVRLGNVGRERGAKHSQRLSNN